MPDGRQPSPPPRLPVYQHSPGQPTPPGSGVRIYNGPPPGFKASPADTYSFGPPPSAGEKPLWAMNQQELQALAFKQAQAYYQPILDELHRQQQTLETRNTANKAGLQKLIEAVQGSARGLGDETGRGLGDAFAGLAGQAGQEQYLTVSQNEDQQLNDLLGKIMEVTGQIPGQAQQILGGLSGQVAAHDKATAPIIRSVGGSLVAVDPTTGQTQVLYGGGGGPKWQTRSVGGNLYRIDPATGRSELLIKAPPKASANRPVTKTVGGSLYEWDPQTRQWDVAVEKPASTHYQHTVIGGKAYTFDPASGTFYDPATGQAVTPKNSPPKGVTAATIAKGWKLLNQSKGGYWTREGDGQPLTTSQLRGVLKDFNSTIGKAEKVTLTMADLPNLNAEQSAALGISRVQPKPDEIYLRLVREVGVPSRRAWQMVRRIYPTWGKGYYRPKADAAPDAATGSPIPLTVGKLIGFPNQGSHTLYGNWQSDNAVDFSAPVGTPIYAVADGVIGPRIGPFSSQDPHLAGSRVTVVGGGNEFYYAHLSRLAVKAGQRVKKGQLIGYSGSANGTAHLHFATKNGDPAAYFHGQPAGGSRTLAGANPVKNYAFSQAAKLGWGTDDLKALNDLWQHESNWDATAKNPGSGALGIPQALGHTLPAGYADDPQVQINWGLNYIKETYGSPTRAWAFWRATVNRNASLAPADLRGKARIWIRKHYQGY